MIAGLVTAALASFPGPTAEDLATVASTFAGSSRYLATSMYVATDARGQQMLQAAPKPPGSSPNDALIFPAGTPVTLLAVEFATPVSRWFPTPRHPTIGLRIKVVVKDALSGPVAAMDLTLDARTSADFRVALDRYFSTEEPLVDHLSDGVRDAMRTKRLVRGMSTRALTMSWGYPRERHLWLEGSVAVERWDYGTQIGAVLLRNETVRDIVVQHPTTSAR